MTSGIGDGVSIRFGGEGRCMSIRPGLGIGQVEKRRTERVAGGIENLMKNSSENQHAEPRTHHPILQHEPTA